MNRTFTAQILNLVPNSDTGYVSSIVWDAYLVENGLPENGYYTGVSRQETNIPVFDTDSYDFVPFEQITESQALNWVMTYSDIEQIKSELAEQIESYKNPPLYSPSIPWGDGL